MIWRLLGNLSGVGTAYLVAAVNALLTLLIAFGVMLSNVQTAAITTAINAVLVLVLHLASKTQSSMPPPPGGS